MTVPLTNRVTIGPVGAGNLLREYKALQYRVDDNVRWVVIVGLVISVFGSLVVAFVNG